MIPTSLAGMRWPYPSISLKWGLVMVLMISFHSCDRTDNVKSVEPIDVREVLDQAEQLARGNDVDRAHAAYQPIAYDADMPLDLRYRLINGYRELLIETRRSDEARRFAHFWFKDQYDTSVTYMNDLQYFLLYSQSYRLEDDFCRSLVYIDSLLVFIEQEDLTRLIDTSVVTGNYIDLMKRASAVDTALYMGYSMSALSKITRENLKCVP